MINIPVPFLAGVVLMRLRRRVVPWRLLACVLLAAGAINARASCPVQQPESRVVDAAGLLGAKSDVIALDLAAFQLAAGHQLYLLTVASLDGMSIEECGVTVFKQWQLGRKGIDDGVLLLVAVKERKIRIKVGYGLEGTLTDAQSSRIIRDVMVPLFARGEYAAGVEEGLGAIKGVLGAATPVGRSKRPSRYQPDSGPDPVRTAVLCATLIVPLLMTQPFGILGLVIFSTWCAIVGWLLFRDERGYLLAALLGLAWCVVRWRLIRTDVRKLRLRRSRHKTLIWIWFFCAFGFAARVRPPKIKQSPAGDAAWEDGSFFNFSGADAGVGDGGGWRQRRRRRWSIGGLATPEPQGSDPVLLLKGQPPDSGDW